MKQNKFLGALTIALSLVLAACGGGKTNSNSGGASGDGSSECSHSWQTQTIVAAKCEEKGSKHQVCKKCGAEKPNSVQDIAPLGHDWEESITTQPTCTAKGLENRTCKREGCGKTETGVEVDALGHQFSTNVADLVVDDPAAVGHDGSGHYVCTREGCPGDGTHTPGWSDPVKIDALVPSVTVSKASFEKDGENVMLKLEGTTQYFTKTDTFKWALGLHDGSDGYLTGKAAPEAADYAVDGTLSDHTPAQGQEADPTVLDFEVSFNLTAIAKPADGSKAGTWRIKAGPDATNYDKGVSVSLSNTAGNNTVDEAYNYYWRNDQEVGNALNICIDELAPFHFQTAKASFTKGTPAEGDNPAVADKVEVRIGGKARRNDLTVEELKAKDYFLQFQTTGNSYFGPDGHSGNSAQDSGITVDYAVETVGTDLYAYIVIDISFMVAQGAQTYNTHLNTLAKKQQNCVMETDFEELPVEISDTLELIVFSHPKGANDANNSYGNLGFRVQNIPTVSAAPAAGLYRGMALGADGKTYIPVNFNIAEGDTFAVSNLEVNGAAVGVTSAEFVTKGGYLNIVTDNAAYGTLRFMYRDSELKLVGVSGAAAAMLNLDFRGQFYSGCQFIDCSDKDITTLNNIFLRRYDRNDGNGWQNNTPDQNKMAVATAEGRTGLKCNGFNPGKIGLSLKNDIAEPISGSKIKSIGCWIYNSGSAEVSMKIYGYTEAGRKGAAELNTFKVQPGWGYYQTGVVNGGSFKSTNSLYNFQIYYENLTIDPIFDDFCIYM